MEVELEYVHGYRAKDQRNNIRYLKNGNIAYTAAALGIVFDIKENSQKYIIKIYTYLLWFNCLKP